MTADYVSAFTIANARPQNICCTGPLDSGDRGNSFICSEVTTFASVQEACELGLGDMAENCITISVFHIGRYR